MTEQKPLGLSFGRKAEPTDIMAGIDLSGKSAVVTGGYSGIGLETVRALTAAGAEVLVPARRPDVAEKALADIPRTSVAAMDLADLNSVRSFAEERADAGSLDLLINNAGIMASPLNRLGNDWEGQLAVNHLGHFLLSTLLLPALRKADAPRVVTLSSLAHRISPFRFDDPHFQSSPYEKWVAYGQAKTANALFARELNRREDGLLAFSVHPGGIMTDLQRHLPLEEQVALGWTNEDGSVADAVKDFFKTPPQGAGTTLVAATSPKLADSGGVYLEDCDVAGLVPDDDAGFFGVRSWATSDEDAARLWTWTEETLAA